MRSRFHRLLAVGLHLVHGARSGLLHVLPEFGTRATLDAKSLSASQTWVFSGQGSGEPDKLQNDLEVTPVETPHHMQNFFDCIRSRKQPVAPIEAGYAHSVAVIMADEALVSGKRMLYDATHRDVHAG